MKLSVEDLKLAEIALADGGPSAMYDYLAGKGDKYAVLANGVARGDSIAGVVAINYMKSVVADAGIVMGDEQVDNVRVKMANAYMSALRANLVDGVVQGPLPQSEVARFHAEVFSSSGYPESSWTLQPIFMSMPQDSKDIYWKYVLSAAGDIRKELDMSLNTHIMMGQASVMGIPEAREAAQKWIKHIEAPSGWSDVAATGLKNLFNLIPSVESFAPDEANSPTSPIKIEISPTTESRRDLQGQDDIRNDVSAGYVNRRLTHSIAFTDNTLNKTDFTSAQLGSLATGGIRPGELQVDPNVRPN